MPIAGVISSRPAAECEPLVAAMIGRLRHGRFEVSGTRSWPELGLYAGWTAQPDSCAAAQVFTNETGDVALLLTGECFAPPGRLQELVAKGHAVGSASGDWLVHHYEELGENFFGSLNGLFGGLLVDRRTRRAFLFNDRYGIERLYWSEWRGDVFFASEAKALLRVLPETRAWDAVGVAQFLGWGCTGAGRTLFRGIQLAPGGIRWTVTAGQCDRGTYFQPAAWEALPELGVREFQARFSEIFPRLLPLYFSGGQRVGISLTGGLDTRMILACLPSLPVAPVCYTFAGANPRMRDAVVAGEIARACGLRHELLRIGPDFFRDFGDLADRTVFTTDGCFGVLGAHEIYLNALARALSPVRLTGNFGSEVLRSVSTFKPLGLAPELFSPELAAVGPAADLRPPGGEHPVRFAAFREIPWHLFGSLCAGRSQVAFRTPYLDNEIVALAFQAPPAARQSGASAVEFIRQASPRMATIPTDRGEGGEVSAWRRKLRRVHAEVTFKLDYYCSEGLPLGLTALDPLFQRVNACLGIQGQHKFLTYRNWLRRELVGWAEERLAAAAQADLPFLDSGKVRRLGREHATGRRNFTREINAVLTLEAVRRLLLRPDGGNGFHRDDHP